MTRAETGAMGEQLAAEHYESRGYTLFCKNFRTRQGEIDLILQKGQTYVFCEVKTRGANAIAQPREWVDAKKQEKIKKTALAWLAKSGLGEPFLRFDVLEVAFDSAGTHKINCIENAF